MEERRVPRPREQENGTNGTHRTNWTHEPPLIPAHGGYRDLKSYQTAEIVYDATVAFCDRFIDRQLESLEQRFLKEGGFTERLYRARRHHRGAPNSFHPSHRSHPSYPDDHKAREAK